MKTYSRKIVFGLIAFALWAVPTKSNAQEEKNPFSIGFKTLQIQNDFGLGVDLVSPYFLKKKMALKLGYQLQWLEHLKGNQVTWTSYSTWQFGIKSRRPVWEQKLFVTAEGGAMFILPSDQFSTQDSDLGIYGLLGIDWITTDHLILFMEFGAGGSKSRANKVDQSPIYTNGFISQVGFRIHL